MGPRGANDKFKSGLCQRPRAWHPQGEKPPFSTSWEPGWVTCRGPRDRPGLTIRTPSLTFHYHHHQGPRAWHLCLWRTTIVPAFEVTVYPSCAFPHFFAGKSGHKVLGGVWIPVGCWSLSVSKSPRADPDARLGDPSPHRTAGCFACMAGL